MDESRHVDQDIVGRRVDFVMIARERDRSPAGLDDEARSGRKTIREVDDRARARGAGAGGDIERHFNLRRLGLEGIDPDNPDLIGRGLQGDIARLGADGSVLENTQGELGVGER